MVEIQTKSFEEKMAEAGDDPRVLAGLLALEDMSRNGSLPSSMDAAGPAAVVPEG